MGLEGLKMIFWESTKIGFVSYPPALTKLYNFTPFKDGLRLLMALLTLFALLYLVRFLWKNRKNIFLQTEPPDEPVMILSCITTLIIPYIGIHSFFFILTRYALPLAPLYLLVIAFSLNGALPKQGDGKALDQ